MKKKIAIDTSPVIYGTGVSVYTNELIRGLKKDNEFEYVFFGYSFRQYKNIRNIADKALPIPPTLADFIWNKLHYFPIESVIGDFDLIHTSDWVEPYSKKPKVTTIHDLTPILYSNKTDPKVVSVHKRKLQWVMKESRTIITPSEATKRDLIKLGFKQNIEVIAEAVSEDIYKRNLEEVDKIKKKYRISDNYLLIVGTNDRKNIKNVFKAFEKIKSELKIKNLVVVGSKPKDFLQDRGVIYVGRVNNNELSALYSGAKMLIYASLYEGFGLPILEAFKCECPVVTSNISSMPEVAADAAILVDPYKTEEIAKGILKCNKARKELINLGLRREKLFSWSENIKRTINVYNNVLN